MSRTGRKMTPLLEANEIIRTVGADYALSLEILSRRQRNVSPFDQVALLSRQLLVASTHTVEELCKMADPDTHLIILQKYRQMLDEEYTELVARVILI